MTQSVRTHGTPPGHSPRPVRNRRQDRPGRHGRGVPRDRHESAALAGHQGAARRCRRRCRAARAISTRSGTARRTEPPEHRADLRSRTRGPVASPHPRVRGSGGRRGTPTARAGDGARRGAHARRPDRPRRTTDCRSARRCPASRRGARGRAQSGDHPPRPQAVEHQSPAGWHRQAARLRSGEGG